MKSLFLFFVIVAICFGFPGFINATKSKVMKSINHMSLDFFKVALRYEQGNFICSPISISQVLTMISVGAKGKTVDELQKVLRLENLKNLQMDSFDISMNIGKDTTNMINRLYVDKDIHVDKTYEWLVGKMFRSEIGKMDFKNIINTVRTINNWVMQNTKNHIKDLISNEDIKNNDGILLVNAIYFKAEWYYKFIKKLTKNKIFYVNETYQTNVQTMNLISTKLKYQKINSLGAHIVELPYKIPGEQDSDELPIESDDRVSMFLIFTDKHGGLKNIEKYINLMNLTSLHTAKETLINLSLPKFKLETNISIENYMKKMGMISAFSDDADFSGITKNRQLFISKIKQKAFIEVNEDGTVATAATYIKTFSRMNENPLRLEVNRPFIVILATKKVILFTARISNPSFY